MVASEPNAFTDFNRAGILRRKRADDWRAPTNVNRKLACLTAFAAPERPSYLALRWPSKRVNSSAVRLAP
jgi:hypothetical protein